MNSSFAYSHSPFKKTNTSSHTQVHTMTPSSHRYSTKVVRFKILGEYTSFEIVFYSYLKGGWGNLCVCQFASSLGSTGILHFLKDPPSVQILLLDRCNLCTVLLPIWPSILYMQIFKRLLRSLLHLILCFPRAMNTFRSCISGVKT